MSALQHMFWDTDCADALSDARLLTAMARFEGSLAAASVASGLVPDAAAKVIAQVAATAQFDPEALATAARLSGTLTIPLVKQLTAMVAAKSSDAARYVHFGATSQDTMDTAVALCLVPATDRLLFLSTRMGNAAAAIAKRHARTPSVSRTLLQPAVPVPFGWKAAVWLSMIARAHSGFRTVARAACSLQLGGASGTLSAYRGKGDAIADSMAIELGLVRAPVTWHSARDGFARLGTEAAILAGGAGKIARDISLLMQAEVGEASEPASAGRGGSSAMPHKRNPVGCLAALEASQRAPGLAATLLAQLAPEHERGIGQWQGQWFTLRVLLCSTGGALAAMAEVLEGLTLDERAMRANIDRTRGLVFSENVSLYLSRTLGRQAAHALTEKLCEAAVREGKTLAMTLRDDPAGKAMSATDLDELFDPESCYGSAPAMIERALAEWVRSTAP
ncbi:MAG: adenylosuccinate lyase family protein [Betaproteobacteria bacterium]|nr:adenylosuccinate lyase family protein [Betaproteobacteria bacterium]